MTPKRLAATMAVAAAIILALGCSSGSPTQTSAPPVVDGTASAPAAKIAQIGSGEGYTFDGGLRVAVIKAERFKASDTSVGLQSGHIGIKVQVQATNGSGGIVDLTFVTVSLAYGDAGSKAERIFDARAGLGDGIDGKVAPGRNATGWYGFSVDPAGVGRLDVEVDLGLDYDSVLFTGSVA